MANIGFLMMTRLYESSNMRESPQVMLSPIDMSNEWTWIHRHHMFLLTFNDKLFLAPMNNPKRVMDVGTGLGLWASYGLRFGFEIA